MQTQKTGLTPARAYVIVAKSANPAKPPKYFRRYEDRGALAAVIWTSRPEKARPLPADEATVEAKLLAPTYPTRTLAIEAA